MQRRSQKKTICVVYDGPYLEWSLRSGHNTNEEGARLEFRKIHAAIRVLLEQYWTLPPGGCSIIDAHYFAARTASPNVPTKSTEWTIEKEAASVDIEVHYSAVTHNMVKGLDETLIATTLERLAFIHFDALALVSADLSLSPLLKAVRRQGCLAVLVIVETDPPTPLDNPTALIEESDVALKLRLGKTIVGDIALPSGEHDQLSIDKSIDVPENRRIVEEPQVAEDVTEVEVNESTQGLVEKILEGELKGRVEFGKTVRGTRRNKILKILREVYHREISDQVLRAHLSRLGYAKRREIPGDDLPT